MKIHGDYEGAGYAHLQSLLPPEVAEALLNHFWRGLKEGTMPFSFEQYERITKPALELHNSDSAAVTTFLWGLTPIVSQLANCDLLPTFAFFRLYQNGDKLRVHTDREACEHSISLTLGYSDGEVWAFDVGQNEASPDADDAEDFGGEPFSSIAMQAGDAVLYKGRVRGHGRLTPNPNKWSAHLFLNWVDRTGPFRAHAFEEWPDAPALGN